MSEIKHIKDELLDSKIRDIINMVATHLLKRIQHYGIKHGEYSPYPLGNSLFWFVRDNDNHTMKLGFNESPRFWDIEQIKLDIMVDEHNMFVELGVIF